MVLQADVPKNFLPSLKQKIQKDGIVVFMPSRSRSGETWISAKNSKPIIHDKGNLLTENGAELQENDLVLVFVERHEEKGYKVALKSALENQTHALVVLPDGWVGRGVPIVREVIKLFAEALKPHGLKECIQMDDDTSKFTERMDATTVQLSARTALWYMREVLRKNSKDLAAVGLTPSRYCKNASYKKDNLVYTRSITACSGVFMYDIKKAEPCFFVPHRWFDYNQQKWDEINAERETNDTFQQCYFQREDRRFCAQLATGNYLNTAVVVHVIVEYKKIASQARTKNENK